jgi:hypothetical protein
MSAPDRADLLRAKNLVRVTQERGVVYEDDLPAILGCSQAELRTAIGIAFRWRRIDRCGSWLVAVSSRDGRRAA